LNIVYIQCTHEEWILTLFELGINNLLNNGGLPNGQPSIGSEIEVGETTKTAYYEPWRNRATIKGMIPGRQYIFNISGETRIGRGPVASLEQRMPILGKIISIRYDLLYLIVKYILNSTT